MNIEFAAAEALLDQGVSVPFLRVRVPFTGRSFRLCVTMRRPRLGGQLRITRHLLKLGATTEQIRAFTRDQHMEFMAQHGKRLSKMVALTICRGYLSGWLLTPLVAFAVRWCVTPERILGAHLEYVSLLGANPFLPIIRSAELMNPLTPRLSHDKKRS